MKKKWTIYMLLTGLILTPTGIVFITGSIAETRSQQHAIAVLHPTAGNQTSGVVNFVKTTDGIRITAEISGLSPGEHGFHIHQWGDCSAGDGTSAGGHYNPNDQSHGSPSASARHVGDLGNINVQADGNSKYDRVDKVISLSDPDSIAGRAVIVHAGSDDMQSQPTGAAGGRLACGVIGWAK